MFNLGELNSVRLAVHHFILWKLYRTTYFRYLTPLSVKLFQVGWMIQYAKVQTNNFFLHIGG